MVEVKGLRVARPEDYDRIVAVINAWWGRPVSTSLPRLFLDHFWSTSRVAEDEHGLAGFLVAFVSPSQPNLAYVHFVGVPPDHRNSGLARQLYEAFADHARNHDCTALPAITHTGNFDSVRLHPSLGFTAL
mgnify:CR=1 FL=1